MVQITPFFKPFVDWFFELDSKLVQIASFRMLSRNELLFMSVVRHFKNGDLSEYSFLRFCEKYTHVDFKVRYIYPYYLPVSNV